MELKILAILEEQATVNFTGKVNVLSNFNHQFLGHVLFKDGEIIRVHFNGLTGIKGLYHIFLQEYSLQSFQYIIEPEVVDGEEREIFWNLFQLKEKMSAHLKEHQRTAKQRPPDNVKVIIDAEFLEDSLSVTPQEFEVLVTLAEWNSAYDIYQHCPLLDHEITTALVGLRKKSALKILATRSPA